jgi:hypothetical protein
MEQNMKKRVMVGLLCMVMGAGTATAETYLRYKTGDWSATNLWNSSSQGWGEAIALPAPGDTVVLDVPSTMNVDTDSTIGSIQVGRDNGSGTATLNVNTAGKTLTVTGVSTVGRTVNGGTIDVTAGTMVVGNVTINANGLIDINGGTVTVDNSSFKGLNGTGLIKLQAGTFSSSSLSAANSLGISTDVEISGGTLNMGQTYFGEKVTVKGDGASITVGALNSQETGINGEYIFNLDSDGISTIASSSYISLLGSTIAVDGSAYAGGVGTFTLFSSGNLVNMADSYDNVTGFTGGLSGSISQEGNNIVLTVIPEPATLGLIAAFGGGMLFIRRLFQI